MRGEKNATDSTRNSAHEAEKKEKTSGDIELHIGQERKKRKKPRRNMSTFHIQKSISREAFFTRREKGRVTSNVSSLAWGEVE